MIKKFSRYILMGLLMVITMVVPGCKQEKADFVVNFNNEIGGEDLNQTYIEVGEKGQYYINFSAELVFKKEKRDVKEYCILKSSEFTYSSPVGDPDYYFSSRYDENSGKLRYYFDNRYVPVGTHTFQLTTTLGEETYSKDITVKVVETFSKISLEYESFESRVGDSGYINVYYNSLEEWLGNGE